MPNDEFYSIESIVEAMKEGAGYTPGIECNNDSAGNSQLYQVYLCVDTSGKTSLSVLSFQRKDVLLKFSSLNVNSPCCNYFTLTFCWIFGSASPRDPTLTTPILAPTLSAAQSVKCEILSQKTSILVTVG